MRKLIIFAAFVCFAALHVNAQTEETETSSQRYLRLSKTADENPTDWKAQLEIAHVLLDKEGGFIGRDALLKQKTEGTAKKLIGIELHDKAIPRHGYTVLNMEGQPIGEVTTGYHGLSVDKSVCMALVDTPYAKLGTEVQIQIRKKVFLGTVVKKRFYDKHYKKS